jgi:hypothetical protein
MRGRKLVGTVLVSLAMGGMLFPEMGMAAEPVVTDVALADGGILQGQVIQPQTGLAMANTPVTLRTQDQVVAVTTTGSDGRFVIQGVRGGVHQLAAGDGQGAYRFWSPGTAPPSAKTSATVYTQTVSENSNPNVPVALTQHGGKGPVMKFLTNPIVIGAAVATAIAVPIAVANSHHHSSS